MPIFMTSQAAYLRWLAKPLLFLACLAPLSLLLWRAVQDDLGANPVEALTHGTGDWALRLLLLTLAVTPLRRLTGWVALLRFRRMLGLFAFFYACLHFLIWLLLDHTLILELILDDLTKRPYVMLGFSALVLMIPLAVTSTRGMMRRLGWRWQRLHRLVYPIGILAVAHYLWLVKADYREPLLYAGVLALLLGLRVPMLYRNRGVPDAGRVQATRAVKMARSGAGRPSTVSVGLPGIRKSARD